MKYIEKKIGMLSSSVFAVNDDNIPSDIASEQVLLSCIILHENALVETISVGKNLSLFYYKEHQNIYNAILEVYRIYSKVDIVNVQHQLKISDCLIKEDPDYLLKLLDALPGVSSYKYHLNILIEYATKRQLIILSQYILKNSLKLNNQSKEVLSYIYEKLERITQAENIEKFFKIDTIIDSAVEYIGELRSSNKSIVGIASNYKDLDHLTAGFHKGDFIILGARPSMGKTAFALNIAQQATLNNKDPIIGIFSLEMGAQQLVCRMLSSISGIKSEKIRLGNINESEWKDLILSSNSLSEKKIYIDDTPGIEIEDLVNKAKILHNKHGLDLLIIDYLQLIRTNKHGINRQEEVSYISKTLKSLARELNIPVIALTQLSRSLETRPDKRPIMSDIRESGSIEQDADLIAFLYRDDYYNKDSDQRDIMEVIIGKQRNGPIGTVKLLFDKTNNSFMNLSFRE